MLKEIVPLFRALRVHRFWFCLLGAVAAAAGQSAPPAAPANPHEYRHFLFEQARAAARGADEGAAPAVWFYIADHEWTLFPDDAVHDTLTAFAKAHTLASAGSGAGPAAQQLAAAQSEIEALAVQRLEQHGRWTEALGAARQCEGLKSACYDPLVGDAGSAEAARAGVDARALAQECRALDGSFPYQGVQKLVSAGAGGGWDDLIRAGYAAAGEESAVAGIRAALPLLQAGERRAPQLDAEIEPVLVGALARLGTISEDDPDRQLVAATGAAYYTLLAAVDAERAAGVGARMPIFVPSPGVALQTAAPRLGAFEDGVYAPQPADPAQAAGFEQALTQAQQPPAPPASNPAAAQALETAVRLLDDTLLDQDPTRGPRLAQMLVRRGRTAAAATLIARSLDAADRRAAQLEARYAAANLNGELRMVYGGQWAESDNPVEHTYTLAAGLDFAGTANHALAMDATLQRPMALAAVAAAGN